MADKENIIVKIIIGVITSATPVLLYSFLNINRPFDNHLQEITTVQKSHSSEQNNTETNSNTATQVHSQVQNNSSAPVVNPPDTQNSSSSTVNQPDAQISHSASIEHAEGQYINQDDGALRNNQMGMLTLSAWRQASAIENQTQSSYSDPIPNQFSTMQQKISLFSQINYNGCDPDFVFIMKRYMRYIISYINFLHAYNYEYSIMIQNGAYPNQAIYYLNQKYNNTISSYHNEHLTVHSNIRKLAVKLSEKYNLNF
jgi:hypothetical protein